MQNQWLETVAKKTSRQTWVRNHRVVLMPIMDVAMDQELMSMTPDAPNRQEKLDKTFESKVGSCLFQVEGKALQFKDYLDIVKQRVHDLEMSADVTQAADQGTKQSLVLHVKSMVRHGHTLWTQPKMVPVAYLSEHCQIEFENLYDY